MTILLSGQTWPSGPLDGSDCDHPHLLHGAADQDRGRVHRQPHRPRPQLRPHRLLHWSRLLPHGHRLLIQVDHQLIIDRTIIFNYQATASRGRCLWTKGMRCAPINWCAHCASIDVELIHIVHQKNYAQLNSVLNKVINNIITRKKIIVHIQCFTITKTKAIPKLCLLAFDQNVGRNKTISALATSDWPSFACFSPNILLRQLQIYFEQNINSNACLLRKKFDVKQESLQRQNIPKRSSDFVGWNICIWNIWLKRLAVRTKLVHGYQIWLFCFLVVATCFIAGKAITEFHYILRLDILRLLIFMDIFHILRSTISHDFQT